MPRGYMRTRCVRRTRWDNMRSRIARGQEGARTRRRGPARLRQWLASFASGYVRVARTLRTFHVSWKGSCQRRRPRGRSSPDERQLLVSRTGCSPLGPIVRSNLLLEDRRKKKCARTRSVSSPSERISALLLLARCARELQRRDAGIVEYCAT